MEEEEYIPQPKLTKAEVLDKYAQMGFDPQYGEYYWKMYCSLYDTNIEEALAENYESDDALSADNTGMPWYIMYKEIGHPEWWCEKAWNFGVYDSGKVDSLEDIADLLKDVYFEHWKEDHDQAAEELKRQCAFIGQKFGKSELYMRFFYEWFEDCSGGRDCVKNSEELAYSYQIAIDEGKDDDFAYYYAKKCLSLCHSVTAWYMAEQRERFRKEGFDEDYIKTYLCEFDKKLEDHGFSDRYPEWWELNLSAYMRGWDYARKHGLDNRFADVYLSEYKSYNYNPTDPKADEKALERALERYNRG